MIVEDAHVNGVGVVEDFHEKGLKSGDYLIVEDTNKTMWELDREELDKEDWDYQELLDEQELIEKRRAEISGVKKLVNAPRKRVPHRDVLSRYVRLQRLQKLEFYPEKSRKKFLAIGLLPESSL